MKYTIYTQLNRYLNQHPKKEQITRTVTLANHLIAGLVYAAYPLFLLNLFLLNHDLFWRALIIPGISFVLLSIFRTYVNSPRPYEVLDIQPLIDKDTKGKSFPSRHVFSIFVIAMTIYNFYPLLGFILIFLGVILAILRVISGVHFPKDVIVGALVGIVTSVIGFLF